MRSRRAQKLKTCAEDRPVANLLVFGKIVKKRGGDERGDHIREMKCLVLEAQRCNGRTFCTAKFAVKENIGYMGTLHWYSVGKYLVSKRSPIISGPPQEKMPDSGVRCYCDFLLTLRL